MHFLQRSLFIFSFLFTGGAFAEACFESAGAKTPSKRYKDLGQGVVKDTQTGLSWMRCPIGMSWANNACKNLANRVTWDSANTAIAELNSGAGFAGKKDWRLPTFDELKTLMEKKCFEPAINSKIFPNTPYTGFWSSTEEPGYRHGAWLVYFRHGGEYMGNKEQTWAVRAVRK